MTLKIQIEVLKSQFLSGFLVILLPLLNET